MSPTARALRPLTPTGNVPVRSTADRPNPTHYLLFTTPVLRFLRSKKLETVRGTGTLPVWGAGGEAPRPAGGKVPGEAMPPSRQAGLRALSVGRPCALRGLIFNQAPVAGRNGIFLNKNSLPLDWM